MEMQYPFTKWVFGNDVKVVPILVGSLSLHILKSFKSAMEVFIRDDSTVFLVSSDFCHWGQRFGFQPFLKSPGSIHKNIEDLDKEGILRVTSNDYQGFLEYIEETGNTICGQNPILAMLYLLDKVDGIKGELLSYSQSEQVTNPKSSSVSYASIIMTSQ